MTFTNGVAETAVVRFLFSVLQKTAYTIKTKKINIQQHERQRQLS